jgi:Na+-driven multidrug efflux pump
LLADEQFHAGAVVIPAVVMGYIFYALAGVYNRYSGYYKMTYLQSIGSLGAGVINILLNYWLIPVLGIVGAAYVTMISYGIQALLTWILVEKLANAHVSSIRLFIYPLILSMACFIFITLFIVWI